MIYRLLIGLLLVCIVNAETFEYKALDIPSDDLTPWAPNEHEIQGEYYSENGDEGGEIILKPYLAEGGGEKLLFYGVIFEPAPMLEKQAIKVLSSLTLKDTGLVWEKGALKFYKFKFKEKEIRGILYNNCFFELNSE